jgi:hypothetical protein
MPLLAASFALEPMPLAFVAPLQVVRSPSPEHLLLQRRDLLLPAQIRT